MNDDSLMYFGKHKGKKLGDVPSEYLLWLSDQDWIEDHHDLFIYINTHYEELEEDVAHRKQWRL